jgi:hypothetical protein
VLADSAPPTVTCLDRVFADSKQTNLVQIVGGERRILTTIRLPGVEQIVRITCVFIMLALTGTTLMARFGTIITYPVHANPDAIIDERQDQFPTVALDDTGVATALWWGGVGSSRAVFRARSTDQDDREGEPYQGRG